MKLITNTTNKNISIVKLIIDAGARKELKYPIGTAHFFEHLLLRSAKNESEKSPYQPFAILGADENAFTDYENISVCIPVPNENVEKVLSIVSDLIYKLNINKKDFYTEKQIVIREIMSDDDDGEEIIDNYLYRYLFKGRVSKDIAGTVNSINRITYNIIIKFCKEMFKSDKMLLVISGPEKNRHYKKIANKYFDINNKFTPTKPIDILKINKIKRKTINCSDFLFESRLFFCFNGIKDFYINQPYYDLMREILANGFASRLFRKIRGDEGLAYYIRSEFIGNYSSNVYFIEVITNYSNISRVEKLINIEIDKISKYGINNEELYAAKAMCFASVYRKLDRHLGEVEFKIEKEFFNEYLLSKEYINILENINLENMNDFFNKMLLKTNKKILIIRGKNK